MPNWCENTLVVTGPAKEVKRFVDFVQNDDGDRVQPLDFNKIIPMPPELNVTSGSTSDLALAIVRGNISKWLSYPWAVKAGITDAKGLAAHMNEDYDELVAFGNQLLENIKNHGHESWYDWSIANWGTKWNAYFHDDPLNDYVGLDYEEDASCAIYKFDTAWAPPYPVIRAAALQFPRLRFDLGYDEPSMGFAGQYIVKGNKVLLAEDWKTYDYDSEEEEEA